MPIRVRCSSCRTRMRVPRRMADRPFHCAVCGQENRPPSASDALAAPRSLPPLVPEDQTRLVARSQLACPDCQTVLEMKIYPPAGSSAGTVPPVHPGAVAHLRIQCPTCCSVLQSELRYAPDTRAGTRSAPAAVTRTRPRQASTEKRPVPTAASPKPVRRKEPEPVVTARCPQAPPTRPAMPALLPEPTGTSAERAAVLAAVRPCTSQPLIDSPPSGTSAFAGAVSLILALLGLTLWLVPGQGKTALLFSGGGLLVGLLGGIQGLRTGGPIALAGLGALLAGLPLIFSGLAGPGRAPSRPAQLTAVAWPPQVGGPSRTVSPEEWVEADRMALELGEVRLRVESASFWPVEPRAARPGPPRGLCVRIRVDHIGQRRSVQFSSWARGHPSDRNMLARLSDEAGTDYPLLSAEETREVRDRDPSGEVRRGEYRQDVLVFRAPVRKGGNGLRLELAGEAVGTAAAFRLAIPWEMIDPKGGTSRK